MVVIFGIEKLSRAKSYEVSLISRYERGNTMCAVECRRCPQDSYTKIFPNVHVDNRGFKFHPTSTDFTADVEKVDGVGINEDILRSGCVKLNAA